MQYITDQQRIINSKTYYIIVVKKFMITHEYKFQIRMQYLTDQQRIINNATHSIIVVSDYI